MNIILLQREEIHADTVILRDRRAEHIRKILKSREGDLLRAGIINGPMGSARVMSNHGREVTLRLDCRQDPPAKAATALILALPRPIMLKRVLAQATAMGVERIMLINARRVEKSFFQSSLLSPAGIRTALLQGLEQAGDTRLPEVSLHPRFRPFIEDELPPPRHGGPLRLLAHPTTVQQHHTFGQAARLEYPVYAAPGCLPESAALLNGYGPLNQQVAGPGERSPHPGTVPAAAATGPKTATTSEWRQLLAIGPEGGWVDFELDRFYQQGFRPFSWGPRILRVDTAVPVLLAMAEAGIK